MGRRIPIELTVMCMVYDGDSILLQNRAKPDWPGLSFPGGHVEQGESLTEAVIREVREETGLTIAHPVLCGVKDFPDDDGSLYMVLFFKSNQFSGTLTSSEEGEMRWVKRSDIDQIPSEQLSLANDFREMLEIFLRDDLSEFYYRKTGDDWTPEIF